MWPPPGRKSAGNCMCPGSCDLQATKTLKARAPHSLVPGERAGRRQLHHAKTCSKILLTCRLRPGRLGWEGSTEFCLSSYLPVAKTQGLASESLGLVPAARMEAQHLPAGSASSWPAPSFLEAASLPNGPRRRALASSFILRCAG